MGMVNKAYLKNKGATPILVAVKTMKNDTQELVMAMLREAVILNQFNHPNIVRLHGIVKSPPIMVMEYCEHGALDAFVRENDVDNGLRFRLARDVARGLAEVHDKGCLHGDIAGRNILIDSNMNAKIGDFGFTRQQPTGDSPFYIAHGRAIAVRWCPGEVLLELKFSQASDVWSWAVVVFEIWSGGQLPYRRLHNEQVWAYVIQGNRLSQPMGCNRDIWRLCMDCWATIPADRPTMVQVVDRLTKLQRMDRSLMSTHGDAPSGVTVMTEDVDGSGASLHLAQSRDQGPGFHHLAGAMNPMDSSEEDESESPDESSRRTSGAEDHMARTSFLAMPSGGYTPAEAYDDVGDETLSGHTLVEVDTLLVSGDATELTVIDRSLGPSDERQKHSPVRSPSASPRRRGSSLV